MSEMMNTVSSDDVIASYREQLTRAHDTIAVQDAKIRKLERIIQAHNRAGEETPPMLGEVSELTAG